MTLAAGRKASDVRLHVGTYARNGAGALYGLAYDGSWSLGPAFADAANASFGTYSPRHGLYFLVDEDGGTLNVLRAVAGDWQRTAQVPTMGAQPCYVALNASEECLAIANYGSGSVALYRLDEGTGIPLEHAMVHQHAGSGPVADRQDEPHAHCVCFSLDDRWLYHVDLGTDEILAYPFDRNMGTLGAPKRAYAAPGGSGPRQLVFHPSRPLALLVSELSSTLTVLDVGDGELTAQTIVSTLPSDYVGDSLGGHVSLNGSGDRVYVTNRGHDSVAVFAWHDGEDPQPLQHAASGGVSPRAFVLLEAERQFALANEAAGGLSFFEVGEDGTLSRTGPDLPLPGAVFLFIEQS